LNFLIPIKSRQQQNKLKEKKVEKKIPVESKPLENKEDKKTLENALTEVKEDNKVESKALTEKSVDQSVQKTTMINSDCKNFAMEDDFLKLRKKMVTKYVDDEMILIAKRVFKVKCFTVEQVKNLSVLFLKDSGKYAFFDMVYPFVADSHNFHVLQNQLTDSYYIDRFKVMLRH
jgi:hypothetical protein